MHIAWASDKQRKEHVEYTLLGTKHSKTDSERHEACATVGVSDILALLSKAITMSVYI